MGVEVKGREVLNCVGVFPSSDCFSDVTDYNLFCNFTDTLEIFTRIFIIFRLACKCNTKDTCVILFVILRCVNDYLIRTVNLGMWAISLATLK